MNVHLSFCTELLSGTKIPSAIITFEIKNTTHLDFQYHRELKEYFDLSVEANCFTLGVKQPLDLEKFYREWVSVSLPCLP